MQILDFSNIRSAAAFWEQKIPLQLASFPTWLWTHFSPYGFYLLAFRGDGRLFLFEERPYRSTCTTSWKYIAQTTSMSISNPIFHPTKPLICLTIHSSTCVWSFDSQATCNLHEMLPYELLNSNFTQCGQYLKGYHREAAGARAKAIILPLSTILEARHSKAVSIDIEEASKTTMAFPDEDEGQLQRSHVSDGVMGLGGNHIKRQKLTQYTHEAAIIWEHPTQPSRTVFRLPRSLAATKIDAIVSLSSQVESRVFVSLDKAQQEFYDLRRPAKECFPMLLERQADTLAMSKSRLLREQPERIQAEGREPSMRKEEQNDDDSGMIASSALLWRSDILTTLNRKNIHINFDFCLPVQGRSSFVGMNLMFWHSLLNATARIPPNTYSFVLAGVKKSTRGAGPLSTYRRRRSAPLLLEGPKNWTQVLQPSAPHIQSKTQRPQETFRVSKDFKWGVLFGLGLGVLTSLIAISLILLGSSYYYY